MVTSLVLSSLVLSSPVLSSPASLAPHKEVLPAPLKTVAFGTGEKSQDIILYTTSEFDSTLQIKTAKNTHTIGTETL